MEEKNLLEDDIIDLTDLLEEGSPPKKPQKPEIKKRMVSEPDSFDLGKEISMDYDVSIEEIEQDATALAEGTPLDKDKKALSPSPGKEEVSDILKEPLGDIESEIDLAIKSKFEEVGLTTKEEEALLKEEPMKDALSLTEEEKASIKDEVLSLLDEPIQSEDVSAPEQAKLSSVQEEHIITNEEMPRLGIPVDMPTEAILDAVISEFKKDMPALLEGIVRPVVKELLQEIISSTREAVPGLVEKVIREEIDKLKKL
jgi:hypothetical protein